MLKFKTINFDNLLDIVTTFLETLEFQLKQISKIKYA